MAILIGIIDKIIDEINKFLYNRIARSTYKCTMCGKESSDFQEIFDCVNNHIYNKHEDDAIERKGDENCKTLN